MWLGGDSSRATCAIHAIVCYDYGMTQTSTEPATEMFTYARPGATYTGRMHDQDHRPFGFTQNAGVRRVVREGCFEYLTLDNGYAATVRVLADPAPLICDVAGICSAVSAISVVPRRHLATYQGGYYEVPAELYGAQVIARAHTPNLPDAYQVFRRVDSAGSQWRSVTPEMTRAEFDAWDGTAAAACDGGSCGRVVALWLDGVVASDPAMYRDPEIFPALTALG